MDYQKFPGVKNRTYQFIDLYYWLKKLSPETEDQNKNERVNWISIHVSV